jgi:hypothetical protein
MNFKIGDRVKVSTIEDVGIVIGLGIDTYQVSWDENNIVSWYPAYQVRLAEEPEFIKHVITDRDGVLNPKNWKKNTFRLSRKEIRKELRKLDTAGSIISFEIACISENLKTSSRKVLRKQLRQLSAEAFCVDKTLAERIDRIADGV